MLMRTSLFAVAIALLTTHQAAAAEKVTDNELQVIYALEADFSEVRENLELAISGQGLVVNYVAYIGKMLERTGPDLGTEEKLYAEAEVFEFCSAKLSREMMAADPHHIAICPYTVQIYTLADQPRRVYVGYRRPPPVDDAASQAVLARIEALLATIVDETID